jgi:hypothetical protein
MNWFRFYHDALDDPKVQRLDPPLFKAWVNLLCLASKSDDRGNLPPVEDIAFALRLSASEALAIVDELVRRDLVDGGYDDLSIHNWSGRQRASDDVTARVRKHRSGPTNDETGQQKRPPEPETLQRNANVTLPKRSGNGLDKSREDKTRTDTAHAVPRARARETADDLDSEFEKFIAQYPPEGHGSIDKARQAYKAVRGNGISAAAIMSGLAKWQNCGRWKRGYVLNAAEWLTGGNYGRPVPRDPEPKGSKVVKHGDPAPFQYTGRNDK